MNYINESFRLKNIDEKKSEQTIFDNDFDSFYQTTEKSKISTFDDLVTAENVDQEWQEENDVSKRIFPQVLLTP